MDVVTEENVNRRTVPGDQTGDNPCGISNPVVNVNEEHALQTTAMAASDPIVDASSEPSSSLENGRNGHVDPDLLAEYHNLKEILKRKDAEMQQANQHLEIILEENNLLSLELEHQEKTAAEGISSLKTDLEISKARNAEMSNRIENIQMATKGLAQILASREKDAATLEPALGKLLQLTGVTIKYEPNKNGPPPLNGGDLISHVEETSAVANDAAVANQDLTTDKNLPKWTTEAVQATKIKSETSVATPNQPVSLRRSLRNSVKSFRMKEEPPFAPATPPVSTRLEEKPTSSRKAVPALPKLHPCPQHAKTKKTLHAVDPSKKGPGYFCICGCHYMSKQRLVFHIRQQTWEWKFNCNECGAKHFEVFKLKKHLWKEHKIHMEGTHGCCFCGMVFKNRLELVTHQRSEHNDNTYFKRGTNKRKNGVIIDNLSSMTIKKESSDLVNGEVVKKAPGKGDKMRKSLITPRHPAVLLKRRRRLARSTAPTILPNIYHRADNSKKDGYFCVCGRDFTTKGGLSVHVKYFTYEAKFKCGRCERKFFSTNLLRTHMKAKHDVIFTGRDGCRQCGRCFPSRLKLYQHCKNVHKCGPLMVNKKNRLPSPDLKPPVLEREDLPNDVEMDQSSSDFVSIDMTARKTRKFLKRKLSVPEENGEQNVNGGLITREPEVETAQLNLAKEERDLQEDMEDETMTKMETEINIESSAPAKLEKISAVNNSKKVKRKRRNFTVIKKSNLRLQSKSPASNTVTASGQGSTKSDGKVLHVETEGSKRRTEIKCSCGKTFTSRSTLSSHIRLKTGRNIHKCSICKEGFPRRDYLRKHMQVLHGKTLKPAKLIQKKAVTVKVNKTVGARLAIAFKSKRSRTPKNGGNSVDHGVDESTGDEATCLCGVRFQCRVTLHEHLRLKIGKRVFQCELCPEGFARYDYFKDHIKRKHQLVCEGMACRDCGARGFPSHKELREHRLEFHPKESEKET